MHPLLYLVSELTNRDWNARLFMADYALKDGYTAVIGQQWGMVNNLAMLPRGLILFKTMNKIQGAAMRHAKSLGYAVAAMDEEALPLATDTDMVGEFLA